MDIDSFIIRIKTEDVYKDTGNNFEKIFDILNYEINRPFPTKKKMIRIMKDKIGGKILTEFVGLDQKNVPI